MTDFKSLKKLSKEYTLLFIEDDKTLRDQTTKIFLNLFKSVDIAEHGQEGLDLYNDYNKKTGNYYDIIVSDIEMPYLNGLELSRKILEINKDQKIVIMSAYDDKEYLISMIKMGIECFMQKPLSMDHLLDTMNKVCVPFKDERSISFGDGYYFNNFLKVLLHKDKRVDISYNETMLLELFLSKKDEKISYSEIYKYVYENDGEYLSSSIDSLIKRLSEKLPSGTIINNSIDICRLSLPASSA